MLLLGLASLTLGLPASAATSRPKTDLVTFDGGSTLLCEIKQLERGKLRVKTANAGTVDIEWQHVDSVESVFTYEVENSSGDRHYGFLSVGPEPRTVVLTDLAEVYTFELGEIVRLTPIRKTFLGRIDGSLSLGLSFAQANNATNFNFAFNASLRSRKYLRKMSASSIITDQAAVDRIERNIINFEFSRFLAPPWSVATLAQAEKNEELDLDLRASVAVGVRRQNIQTNSMLFATVTGISFNQERYSTQNESSTNVEASLGLEFEKFSFDSPQIDVDTSLTLLPSLSNWGRVRAEYDLSLRRELIRDFFLDITAYYSFDSNQAGDTGESSTDYGFTTSLGWSF